LSRNLHLIACFFVIPAKASLRNVPDYEGQGIGTKIQVLNNFLTKVSYLDSRLSAGEAGFRENERKLEALKISGLDVP